MDVGKRHNPYSSHLVEANQGGYIFADGSGRSLHDVIQELETHDYRGELVGLHGAGKSTMLTDICNVLQGRGYSIARWQCRDTQRLFPRRWMTDLRRKDVIVIDGAERLAPGLLSVIRLLTFCFSRNLIITRHQPSGFGAHIPVQPCAMALEKKALQLGAPVEITATLSQRLADHNGNCREVLFDLYLDFENIRQA